MLNAGGPIWMLTWWGRLLPCLEKDEDASARQAMLHINTVGQSIRWYMNNNSNNNNGGGVMGSLGKVKNWFGSNNNNGSSMLEPSSQKPQQQQKESVLARMIIRDNTESGRPEIFIDPLSSEGAGYKLNVSLQRVDRIQTDPSTGLITLYAKVVVDKRQPPKELLKFVLLQPIPIEATEVPLGPDERNLAVHHLQVLTEWEKQRRIAAKDYENDDDDHDDENQPNFLQARAQKATHFAQRELELQQTKRDREARKAKLVAASGGMKYTALAMAGRQD